MSFWKTSGNLTRRERDSVEQRLRDLANKLVSDLSRLLPHAFLLNGFRLGLPNAISGCTLVDHGRQLLRHRRTCWTVSDVNDLLSLVLLTFISQLLIQIQRVARSEKWVLCGWTFQDDFRIEASLDPHIQRQALFRVSRRVCIGFRDLDHVVYEKFQRLAITNVFDARVDSGFLYPSV